MPSTFINLAKGFVDPLNADYARGELTPDVITMSWGADEAIDVLDGPFLDRVRHWLAGLLNDTQS